MRRSVARHVLSPFALILCMASAAAAQARAPGRLTGTVRDSSGAIIQDAAILATNIQTGAVFWATANEVGVWVMPSVPGGSYTVSVNASGFQTAHRDITVDAGATETVDATLQIGLQEEVLVTASKYEQDVVNAPATATVIAERTILNSPSPNLGELLRSVPGMNVVQTSAREFNITSRAAAGLFSGSQLALIDGRTIYHDDVGYLCWDGQATNLSQINQVEVIRGPASAIWGANAMNGIINIITKPPRDMLGTAVTLGVGTFDRSGGGAESDRGSLYYFNASHAQAVNDRWAYKIAAGAFTQDAFARPQGNIPNALQTPYPPFNNAGTTQPMADARVDYDLPDGRQHLTFAGGYGGTSGIMHSQLGPLDVHRFYMKSYGKVEYRRDSLRIIGYVNLSSGETTNLLLVDTSGQPILTDDSNQTYHVEFSDRRVFQRRHVVSYGASFRHNEFDLSLAPEGKRRDEGGVYLQDEILLSDRFRWVIGTRVDKFDSIKGVVVSPRTSFMAKTAAGQALRVSYNRAYMAPSMFMNYLYNPFLMPLDLGLIDPDLAGNYYSFPVLGLGNKDLEEQSLNAYEIGYSATVKGRANLGAAFYVNDIKNGFATVAAETYSSQNPPSDWPLPPFVLDLLGLPSIFQYQNLGKVRNKGIELNIDARFSRYVGGFANYSWQARPEPEGFDISLLNLPPAHRFNAGLDFNNERYLASISVGYVGSAYWTDVIGPPYSGPTNAYTAVNLSAGVRFGGGRYLAMLKVANLANTPIQNHVFGDILRRQVTGELTMQF